MPPDQPSATPTRPAAWLLPLLGLLAAAATLLVVLRRRDRIDAATVDTPTGPLHDAPEPAAPIPAAPPPVDLRLPFVTLAALLLISPLILPPPYSSILFIIFLLLSVGVGLMSGGAARTLLLALNPTVRAWVERLTAIGLRPARLWLLVALALFALSAALFIPIHSGDPEFFVRARTDEAANTIPNDEGRINAALLTLLLGGAAVFTALAASRVNVAVPTPTLNARPYRTQRIQMVALLFGGVLLWLVTEISAEWFDPAWLVGVPHHLQFGLFVAAAGFIAWGLAGTTPRAPSSLSPPIPPRLPLVAHEARGDLTDAPPTAESAPARRVTPAEIGIVAALTLLALLLRAWRLETAAPFFIDELNFANVIDQFRQSPRDLLLPHVMSFSGVYSLWQTWTVGLFGATLAGLRVPSVILGTLSVPALYWLARALFVPMLRTDSAGTRGEAAPLIPLVAALLLATFPPHIHFSRIGINNIADPLFALLALALLVRGLRWNRAWDYALAGVMLGLTQYFYEGGRLLYPLLVGIWLVTHTALNPGRRPDWRGVVTFACAALLVGVPFYHVMVARDIPFTVRLNDVGLRSSDFAPLAGADVGTALGDLWLRLRNPLLAYVSAPDPSLFYGGQTALLLPVLLPPFFVGVALLLRHLRGLSATLLLLWLGGTAVGSSLLAINTLSPRFVVVFPALMLVTAVGLVSGLHLLADDAALRRRVVISVTVLALLLAGGQAVYYFNRHLPVYNVQFRRADPARDAHDAALRSVDFPRATHLHLIGTPRFDPAFANRMLRFLRPDMAVTTLDNDDLTPTYLLQLAPGVDHAFYIESGNLDVLRLLRDSLPLDGPYTSPHHLPPREGYLLYYLPAGADRSAIMGTAGS